MFYSVFYRGMIELTEVSRNTDLIIVIDYETVKPLIRKTSRKNRVGVEYVLELVTASREINKSREWETRKIPVPIRFFLLPYLNNGILTELDVRFENKSEIFFSSISEYFWPIYDTKFYISPKSR